MNRIQEIRHRFCRYVCEIPISLCEQRHILHYICPQVRQTPDLFGFSYIEMILELLKSIPKLRRQCSQ